MIEYETLATRRLGFAVLLICAFNFLFATASQLDAAEKSNWGVWRISALSVSRIRPAATALSKFGIAVFAGGQSASFDDSYICFVIVVFVMEANDVICNNFSMQPDGLILKQMDRTPPML